MQPLDEAIDRVGLVATSIELVVVLVEHLVGDRAGHDVVGESNVPHGSIVTPAPDRDQGHMAPLPTDSTAL